MLNINDVAERCQVSRKTVSSWIESGELTAIDVAPAGSTRKFYRIELAALEQFLESRANRHLFGVPPGPVQNFIK